MPIYHLIIGVVGIAVAGVAIFIAGQRDNSSVPRLNLRNDNALKLHEIQWQNYKRTHDVFYHLPAIYSTIIGGLWYFSYSITTKDSWLSFSIILFSAICSASFLVAITRFEYVLGNQIHYLNERELGIGPNITRSIFNAGNAGILILSFATVISAAAALRTFNIASDVAPPSHLQNSAHGPAHASQAGIGVASTRFVETP